MSYLLEALKKAEQERKQGEQSELPLYTEPEIRASLPVWLIVALATLIALTIYKVVFPNSNTSEKEIDEVLVNETSSREQDLLERDQQQPISSVAPSSNAIPQVDQGELKDIEPKDLSELDPHTLGKIPSLSLESHIYSSAAEYRSVIINGQSYGEGSLLAAGVALDEITQTGIIITVGEQYVVLPKGISWVSTKHAK